MVCGKDNLECNFQLAAQTKRSGKTGVDSLTAARCQYRASMASTALTREDNGKRPYSSSSSSQNPARGRPPVYSAPSGHRLTTRLGKLLDPRDPMAVNKPPTALGRQERPELLPEGITQTGFGSIVGTQLPNLLDHIDAAGHTSLD